MNQWKKTGIFALAGIMMVAAVAIPSRAAIVATEEPVEGANVVIDRYCVEVAAGTVVAEASEVLAGTEDNVSADSQAAPQATAAPVQDGPNVDENGHVELNLNYSRLGIANKVDTYLNVRNKPSKKGKIIGKMTKNSGCHIYNVKDGWAKIVSGDVRGYVKASYMTIDKEAEELATKVGREVVEIQTDSLRVRALPTTDAPIYSIISSGEEFRIRASNLTMDFVKGIIKTEKISDEAIERAGGFENIEANLSQFVCIHVDDEYAFVAKEYVKEQYSLKRAVKVKTVHSSKKSGISSGQASIVEYAKQFLGNPYVWGGSSLTGGTDCSGFTMSLYARYGYSLPHNAAAQAGVTRSVSSPKPGDLFFYSNGSRINHVAMYIGGGMVIHASNPTDGIKISTAYYRHPVKIGRVMN